MEEFQIHPDEVRREFYRATEKVQVITCWVGIFLNLLWFVSDYFVLPDHWIPFLTFRAVVSGTTLLLLLVKDKLKMPIYSVLFVLVLGISVQNAYMWTEMDLAHMQKHTLAYIVLFIGVGMLVLWEFWYSVVLFLVSLAANIILFKYNSELTVEEFTINGGLLTLTVAIFSVFLIRSRFKLTYNEIRSRMELALSKERVVKEHNIVIEQKKEISAQKDAIEEKATELSAKNKEITDSINYARRIQISLIPNEKEFNAHFAQSFVLFKPKDIVSGDFYWVHEKNGLVYYATADCTGHGVPGGFMTMLGLSFLEDIIADNKENDPGKILDLVRERIIHTLKQTGSAEENKDGMDLSLCCLDKNNGKLLYAAANNPVYIIRSGELNEYKAQKQPCGFFTYPEPFKTMEIILQPGDRIYTFTDGYPDQFGGPKGKKFRYKQFEDILLKNTALSMEEQKEVLNREIERWKNWPLESGEVVHHEQVDDILVIGIAV